MSSNLQLKGAGEARMAFEARKMKMKRRRYPQQLLEGIFVREGIIQGARACATWQEGPLEVTEETSWPLYRIPKHVILSSKPVRNWRLSTSVGRLQ